MRHARDELADGRHALALHELIAQPDLVGDVTLDADEMGDRSRRVPDSRDAAGRGKRGAVPAATRHGSAPDSPLPHLRGNVSGQLDGVRSDQLVESQRRQFVARVAQRAEKGLVGLLEPAVGARDENQVARLLRRRRQQLQPRVGALQLLPLRREPQRHQAEAGHGREARQQLPERIDRRAHLLDVEHAVANQWDQEGGHRGQDDRERRDRLHLLFIRARRRRFERCPRVAQPRDDPGEVQEAPDVILTSRDGQARTQPHEEAQAGSHRKSRVRAPPIGLPREPQRGQQSKQEQQPVGLHEVEQTGFGHELVGRDETRHQHEVGIQKDAEEPVGGKIHRDRRD